MKEYTEISNFQILIHKEIDKNGLDVVAKKIYQDLWNTTNISEKTRYRLVMLKYVLSNVGYYPEYRYKHDVLCYFTDALGINPVPRHNLLSSHSTREYDPTKNGKNILKHGVSFNDFIDGGSDNFARYAIGLSDSKYMSFATLNDDCDIRGNSFGLLIFEVRNTRIRPISARKFNVNTYKEVISSAIKDKNITCLEENWNVIRKNAITYVEENILKI